MSDAMTEDLIRKLTAAYAEIHRLKLELQKLKAALRKDLPYDAMGDYGECTCGLSPSECRCY